MKLDILAFGAHPDDVELGCGGTLIKHVDQGGSVGIIDLTRGEKGTRGTPEIRLKEAEHAAEIIGAKVRENLELQDGFIQAHNEEAILRVIRVIRRYRPDIVIANALEDRHPDHGAAAALVKKAFFLSGLVKISTQDGSTEQEAWRPSRLYHYIQYHYRKPDLVIDITNQYEKRNEAILAHKSQFYDPDSNEPWTMISTNRFNEMVEARAREFGSIIYTDFAEGFETETPIESDLLL